MEDTEAYDLIRGFQMDVMPGESPLMTWSTWRDTAATMSAYIKMRLGYGEHETFDLLVQSNMYNANRMNYLYVSSSSVVNDQLVNANFLSGLYIYRVDSIERVGQKGSRTATDNSECVMRFTCTLDLLATLYMHESVNTGTPSFTLDGRWRRLPFQAVVEPFQVRPAQMKRTGTQTLLNDEIIVTRGSGDYHLCWMEISYTKNGVINRVGTFAVYNREDALPISQNEQYPSVWLVISKPIQVFGDFADPANIISIMISIRCPYVYNNIMDISYTYPQLECNDLSDMPWTRGPQSEVDQSYYVYYHTRNGTGVKSAMRREEREGYITLTELERNCGQVVLYDTNDNMVGTIDTRYATDTYTDPQTRVTYPAIKYYMRTYCNDIRITTEIRLTDGTLMRFSEGISMYASSAWQEYARGQLEYDREMAAMSQEKITNTMWQNLSGSIANGAIAAIGGNPGRGVGVASVGMISSVMGYASEYSMPRKEQEAKEQLMRNTPDTLYSNGVGNDYVEQLRRVRFGYFAVNAPSGITDAEMENYIEYSGYPVTDLQVGVTMAQLNTIGRGFLQANALMDVAEGSTSKMCVGHMRTLLDRQLRQGVHFKVITT